MPRNSKNKPTCSPGEELYRGSLSGSIPKVRTYSQNFDFSTFPLLCEKVYELLELEDPYLRRQMPYCVFLHAMNEYLNAYMHDSAVKLLNEIGATSRLIPIPIFEYINGIKKVMTATGLDIDFNLPVGGIPQGPLGATEDEEEMESGSFGSCNAETHNSYECYVSPYVTSKLIERTLYANTSTDPDRFGDWSPLPQGRYPQNGVANRNLLGYQKPEILHNDSISFLMNIDFWNDDTILGQICHSNEVLTRVSVVLSFLSQKFIMTPAKFNKSSYLPEKNSSVFIYQQYTEYVIPPGRRLAEFLDSLYSPESFDEKAANKANYFGYEKQRNPGSVGSCYTVDGQVPEGWEETCNNNFTMTGIFAPRKELCDMATLRDGDHKSFSSDCCRDYNISKWLNRHFWKVQ